MRGAGPSQRLRLGLAVAESTDFSWVLILSDRPGWAHRSTVHSPDPLKKAEDTWDFQGNM